MRLWSHGAASKIAATAAALAVTGAFGVGAYALTQDGNVFDPAGFTSAYGKGANDSQKGYQATPENTDSAANRHNDESSNNDKSAEANPGKDAFSELPNNGRGTTAVAVDANAKPGTSTAVDDPNSDGNGNGGSDNNPTGPVIDNDDDNGGSGDNGDSNGGGGDGSGGNGSSDSDDNGGTTKPDNPGGNGSGGGNGGNGSSGGNTGGNTSGGDGKTDGEKNPTVPTTPSVDVTKGGDTESEKQKPSDGGDTTQTPQIAIKDGSLPSERDLALGTVSIAPVLSYGSASLYQGQSVSAWDLFCAIDASIRVWDGSNAKQYLWYCTKDEFEEYSKKYFKIDGIIYEDGTTVNASDFPVKLTGESFNINVSYSFDGSQSWTSTSTECPCTPEPSRAYIVNPYIEDGEAPEIIATITDGSINLAKYNNDVLGKVITSGILGDFYDDEGYFTKLCLGWEEVLSPDENGLIKKVPVNNENFTAVGRHVYQPRGFADIDSSIYHVKLNHFWLNSDNEVDNDGGTLVYWQTLTSLGDAARSSLMRANASYTSSLAIPEGIQAVDIEENENYGAGVPGLFVDTVEIPASVQYINITSGDFAVEQRFEVSADNTRYSSTNNGVLASKDGTRYLGVPTSWHELTVPADIKSVELGSYNDGLETINIEATDPDELPDINLDQASNCTINVANNEMLSAAVDKYGSSLTPQTGNSLGVSGETGKFTVTDGLMTSGSSLEKVLVDASSIADLSGVKTICAGAFKDAANTSTLLLGEGEIAFEGGCFEDSSVKCIVCKSTDEVERVRLSLKTANTGLDLDNTVFAVEQQSEEGCTYFTTSSTQGDYSVVLKAPDSIESFNGTLTGQSGAKLAVDAIAPRAFANCTSLKWTILGESVKFIGSKAFNGCTSLEGLFVGSKDTITVEKDIFSNCDNVGFFASRAMNATFSGNEVPGYYSVMYCPTGSTGYSGGFECFTANSGVSDYCVISQSDGGYLLYGCDNEGTPWLGLSGYASMSGQIKLPSTTTEIFNYAFYNKGADDGFTINWDELESLSGIDYNAFKYSKLNGGIVLESAANLGESAFEGCSGVTSFTAKGHTLVMSQLAFASCSSLASVRIDAIGGQYAFSNLATGIFEGCNELKRVEFTSKMPMGLSLYNIGSPYSFNFDWNNNEKYRGTISIPEGSLQSYLDEWTYFFAGYPDYDSIEYIAYWNVYAATEYTVAPTEQEVRDEVVKMLLPAENTVRMLVGAESTEKLTVTLPEIAHDEVIDGCTFSVKDGVATLTSVSADAGEVVDFRKTVPEGCDSIVIGENAFVEAPGVKRVILSDAVETIESRAFNKLGNIELVIVGFSIPDLTGGGYTSPFVWGASNMSIKVNLEGYEDPADKEAAEQIVIGDILRNWPMQSLGYADESELEGLYQTLAFNHMSDTYDIDVDAICQEADGLLMGQENFFRAAMDMESITKINQLAYSFTRDYMGRDFVVDEVEGKDIEAADNRGDAVENEGKTEDEAGNVNDPEDKGETGSGAGEEAGDDDTNQGGENADGDESAAPELSAPETPTEPKDDAAAE